MKLRHFVVCVDNSEYPASLEFRKIYEALPDQAAEAHGEIRVIDESGESYLFRASSFLPIELPERIQEAISRAA